MDKLRSDQDPQRLGEFRRGRIRYREVAPIYDGVGEQTALVAPQMGSRSLQFGWVKD